MYTVGKKEKNLIELNVNDKIYHFDFNNGNLIGLRGKSIKIPKTFENNFWFVKFAKNNSSLSKLAETLYLNDMRFADWYFREYDLEKISNAIAKDWNNIIDTIKFIKDNELYNNRFYACTFIKYLNNIELKQIYEERINPNRVSLETFFDLYHYLDIDNYPKRLKTFCHYLNQGVSLVVSSITIRDYYNFCDKLEYEYETGNFIKNYVKVRTDYEMRKIELDTKAITKTQNTYNIAYSNNDYKVVVPTLREEFEKAGRILNNCLGSWELNNRVIPNDYQVGLVYNNDNKLVLAFDVSIKSKHIDQYYTHNNTRPTEESLITFREELQRFILNNN